MAYKFASAFLLFGFLIVFVVVLAPLQPSQDLATNPITLENQKPGTALQDRNKFEALAKEIEARENDDRVRTQLGQSVSGGTWVPLPINGYAGAESINKGEAIDLYISTTKPSYDLEIYRVGYYQGPRYAHGRWEYDQEHAGVSPWQ